MPNRLYACLYLPPVADQPAATGIALAIAQEFSPRYERHRDDLVAIDVSGLERLLGPAWTIGDELRREAAARGVRVHVALAGTRMAALVLAVARPGLTVVPPGEEANAVAPIHIGILEKIDDGTSSRQGAHPSTGSGRAPIVSAANDAAGAVIAFKKWGLKTLGELAALPAADLVARLGRPALAWQAIARGEDIRPLVPTLADERFESSLELEWPIEDLEPLSFVLTRLLEPLSTRLERRDRGAAVLHVLLRLVTRETWARRLELPSPMRDVRTLRTLALLDLDSHPPPAAIDRVTLVIDPTPGRVLQHTLFTRAHPTPEQLSTLVARLGALMGSDRFGAPARVDSYRPGAFTMAPFATHELSAIAHQPSAIAHQPSAIAHQPSAISHQPSVASALRRCRQPVAARVVVADGRPVRVTTDRRGFAGGTVTQCAGPWRTSGDWWAGEASQAGRAGGAGAAGGAGTVGRAGQAGRENPDHPVPPIQPIPPVLPSWNRDEWDVALGDGAAYRIFFDHGTERWFIDAIVD